MEWIPIIVGIVFTVIGLFCIFSIVAGLPGTWIMIFLAAGVEFADRWYLPEGDQQTFNWWLLGSCVALAAVGEALEFLAGLMGAKKAGSSRRGMIGAVIGGLVGALMGTPIPIPIVGSLIGAIIGTFVGALLGELSQEGVAVRDSLKPATGATIGRVLGTLAKLPVAITVWIMLSVSIFWH